MDDCRKEELKPCPFCGGTELKIANEPNQVWCLNSKCHNRGPKINNATKEKAIAAWNRRAAPVVSREAIATKLRWISEEASRQGYPFKGDWFSWYAEYLFALQLPAPVAAECPKDLRDAVNNDGTFQWIVYDMNLMPEQIETREQVCALRAAWMMYQRMLDRPSPVADVPSVEELEAKMMGALHLDVTVGGIVPKGMEIRINSEEVAKAIHALLVERQGKQN